MRSFIFRLVVLALLAAGCQADNRSPALLVIGDSLSAGYGFDPGDGWVALLQRRLDAEGYGYRVANASISGDTTTGGVRRLPRALEKHEPHIVIIELGGNDGLRGTPLAVIEKNLAAMVEDSLDSGARVVIAGIRIPPNYGTAYTEAFAALYSEVADRFDIALIPFFMDRVALDPAMMQADGIHPNASGQPLLLDNVWVILEPEVKATLAAN